MRQQRGRPQRGRQGQVQRLQPSPPSGADTSSPAARRIAQVQRCLVSAPSTGTDAVEAVRARVSAAEWKERVHLAAAYRMSAEFGWDEYM